MGTLETYLFQFLVLNTEKPIFEHRVFYGRWVMCRISEYMEQDSRDIRPIRSSFWSWTSFNQTCQHCVKCLSELKNLSSIRTFNFRFISCDAYKIILAVIVINICLLNYIEFTCIKFTDMTEWDSGRKTLLFYKPKPVSYQEYILRFPTLNHTELYGAMNWFQTFQAYLSVWVRNFW